MSAPAGLRSRELLARLLLDALVPKEEHPPLRDLMPEEDLPSLVYDDETEQADREDPITVLPSGAPMKGLNEEH